MILLEKAEVVGLEAAIRGMRNPMNSWDKSDTRNCNYDYDAKCGGCEADHTGQCYNGILMGPKDFELMKKLAQKGSVHAKYRRMMTVYVDITAPLYWWKEFDTYKVGTVANSCSTMHKIHEKAFTVEDFSHEHLLCDGDNEVLWGDFIPMGVLEHIVRVLNRQRERYLSTKNKTYWWQMIQLLPSSYNQKRTVMLNYEVLAGIYEHRHDHKLDEWRTLCQWIEEELPYSELITGKGVIDHGNKND